MAWRDKHTFTDGTLDRLVLVSTGAFDLLSIFKKTSYTDKKVAKMLNKCVFSSQIFRFKLYMYGFILLTAYTLGNIEPPSIGRRYETIFSSRRLRNFCIVDFAAAIKNFINELNSINY